MLSFLVWGQHRKLSYIKFITNNIKQQCIVGLAGRKLNLLSDMKVSVSTVRMCVSLILTQATVMLFMLATGHSR